jgi:hypothetical protein
MRMVEAGTESSGRVLPRTLTWRPASRAEASVSWFRFVIFVDTSKVTVVAKCSLIMVVTSFRRALATVAVALPYCSTVL